MRTAASSSASRFYQWLGDRQQGVRFPLRQPAVVQLALVLVFGVRGAVVVAVMTVLLGGRAAAGAIAGLVFALLAGYVLSLVAKNDRHR